MNRLTFRDGRGRWTVLIDGREIHGRVADRLAAYENTGMAPDEIRALVQGQKEGEKT